jgi:hypothetical protein
VVFFYFSTNKTDHHNITEILLKVALNTITHNPHSSSHFEYFICSILKVKIKKLNGDALTIIVNFQILR